MTSSVTEVRQALGRRLREIRKDAGITARELARRERWHESKASRIENGHSTPSPADIRAYCLHCQAEDQIADLLATLHNIDQAYMEYRRLLSSGVARGQSLYAKLEASAKVIRNYDPQIIPGLLQTADYARAMLREVIGFYELPDDLDQGVIKRMERQRVLYQRDHRFHYIISEKALYTTVGDSGVMTGQLDRLYSILGMPRLTLGIIPLDSAAKVVAENFVMFDQSLVRSEGLSAESTITQPREIELYGRAFDVLASQARTGARARELISRAINWRTDGGDCLR